MNRRGFDRTHLSIPHAHIALIEQVSQVQPRVVVVLSGGRPCGNALA